ncbi:MAG: choice-of-anchor I domain-containing protein [Candidatus Binatia bacterium]
MVKARGPSRSYGFIGLERTGGIIIYDIADPRRPFFVDYVNTTLDDVSQGLLPDRSPEGVLFIKEEIVLMANR